LRTSTAPSLLAFHEAGHAVVRYLLGRPAISATVVGDENSFGAVRGRMLPLSLGQTEIAKGRPYSRRECVAMQDAAMIGLAGPVAEALHSGISYQLPGEPKTSDERRAIGMVHLLTYGQPEHAYEKMAVSLCQECGELLTANLSSVEAIASSLKKQGTLNGVEIEEILLR
jgi:CheY-specific phosphatase CheX